MPRNGLVVAECASLTGATPDSDGVAVCDTVNLIERAAFVHAGIRVIAAASSLPELVARVATSQFDADRFRIDVHDPSNCLDQSSVEIAIVIADTMPYYPDLKDPIHRFVVVASADRTGADALIFGEIVAQADTGYRRHDTKPWTTSSSLDSRFSRALVNLVPHATSILDPCCGAGSIVVEAAALGFDAFGVDWKNAMVGMTRANLEHFGYDAVVASADSRTHVQHADAIVTDLPYGHAITTDEHTIRGILDNCAPLAPQAVYVAPKDISPWLEAAGYTSIVVHTVNKRAGFTRWVHQAAGPRSAVPAQSS